MVCVFGFRRWFFRRRLQLTHFLRLRRWLLQHSFWLCLQQSLVEPALWPRREYRLILEPTLLRFRSSWSRCGNFFGHGHMCSSPRPCQAHPMVWRVQLDVISPERRRSVRRWGKAWGWRLRLRWWHFGVDRENFARSYLPEGRWWSDPNPEHH